MYFIFTVLLLINYNIDIKYRLCCSCCLNFNKTTFFNVTHSFFKIYFPLLFYIQVNAMRCSGGVGNLTLLDGKKVQPFKGPEGGLPLNSDLKWKVGEAEFESLMRMLDNLVSEP